MMFHQEVGNSPVRAGANFSAVKIGWVRWLACTFLESQRRNYIAAVRDPRTGHASSGVERQVMRMMLG
jgi:hypothetical protein